MSKFKISKILEMKVYEHRCCTCNKPRDVSSYINSLSNDEYVEYEDGCSYCGDIFAKKREILKEKYARQ